MSTSRATSHTSFSGPCFHEPRRPMIDGEIDFGPLLDAARAVQGVFELRKADLKAGAVAAALRTASGAVHTGVCLDLACGVGFCAEHAAIAEMLKHREREIAAIVAVNAGGVVSPCGRCRELILQLTPRNRETVVALPGGRRATMAELLPAYWIDDGGVSGRG